MFTGIVTDIGVIERISQLDHGLGLRVRTAWDLENLAIGASVAHAGVCLTVVDKGSDWFETEAWEEALRLTTLGTLRQGSRVNLERSLRIGDELGGHMVSGHVDGIARIRETAGEGGAVRYVIEAPEELAPFIARKGSVALDGTSLTVNSVAGNGFDVLIIRHTLEVTTWGDRQAGDAVNIEIDQMARYAARLLEFGKG
jgi:riboflavin synthase